MAPERKCHAASELAGTGIEVDLKYSYRPVIEFLTK